MNAASSIFSMLASLALVLALIFALAWLLRRLQGVRTGQAGALSVRAGMQVGAKERILIVEAGGTWLLVGVAPGRVQTLHVFGEAPALPQGAPGSPAESSFAERLRQLLAQQRQP